MAMSDQPTIGSGTDLCPTCHREYPYGDPRSIIRPPRPCFDCEEQRRIMVPHTVLVATGRDARQLRASELPVPLIPDRPLPAVITVQEADGAELAFHYLGVYRQHPAFEGWRYGNRGAVLVLLDDR